jgi:hypothetical protein
MFPCNLLPETPDTSATNNKKSQPNVSRSPNPRTPAILNLPPEVHLETFSYLDRGASALDLPARSSTHRNIHGTVNLYAYNPLPLPSGLDIRRLYDHLDGWIGPNLWFNHATGKFVSRERFRYRAEIWEARTEAEQISYQFYYTHWCTVRFRWSSVDQRRAYHSRQRILLYS